MASDDHGLWEGNAAFRPFFLFEPCLLSNRISFSTSAGA
jgi:hypothetical protein